MKQPPHLFQCLTREEFKTCWAIAFTSRATGYENAYGLERYATPGLEGESADWLEIFKRVIRMLNLRWGYIFTGILPRDDGEIVGGLIEHRNSAFLWQFKSGAIPDPQSALTMALDDEQLKMCGINLEPLRMALDDINDSVRLMMAEHGQEAANLAVVHKEAIKMGREIIDQTIDGQEEFMRKKEVN